MAAASTTNEGLPGATASELFVSSAEPESAKTFEGKVDAADGMSFSSSCQRCDCCPYGYHIDLDFLRFLDSLYKAENLKTLKCFKRRTDTSQSTAPSDHSAAFSLNHEFTKETENMVLISDSDVVSPPQVLEEIDASLCRTSVTSPDRLVCRVNQKQTTESNCSRHLVSDVATETVESSLQLNISDLSIADSFAACEASVPKTEVKLTSVPVEGSTDHTVSGNSLLLEGIFDAQSGRVSPTVLQVIREQLVVSLRRMKELEEQVKVIPILQSRISMLKVENSLLTLTTDRTFCDASVGESSVNDGVDSSKRIVRLLPGSADVETSEFVSRLVDYFEPANGNSVENFSPVSLPLAHLTSTLPVSRNLKTADACVNTDDISNHKRESKSVGILSKAATSDSCIGTSIDFGFGDEIVSYNARASCVLTDQTQTSSSREAVAVSEKSEHLASVENYSGKNPLIDDVMTDVIDSNRFKSVATQCEELEIVGRNSWIEGRDQEHCVALPNGQHIPNYKSTQTDDFLMFEYASEILQTEDYENVPRTKNETQGNLLSSEVTKKRITFGKVTIYEAESSDNEMYVIDNDTPTDFGTDSGQYDESTSSEDHPVLSYSQTQEVALESESSGQSPIECIVVEKVLESPQCGESVIIYDSNESSATSSDSEDSSALSVLEVIPSASIPKAVKSVDEYFDEGIAVEENSDICDFASKTVSEERKNDDKKTVVVNEMMISSNFATKEETENVKVDKLFSKIDPSLDSEKQSEAIEITQNSANTQTSSMSDENFENYKTISENFASSSSSRSEICKESVNISNDFGKEVFGQSEFDAELLSVEEIPSSDSPVSDHSEIIGSLNKCSKDSNGRMSDQQESSIPSTAKNEIESRNQLSDIVSNCHSELLNSSDIAQSSAVKKKIIITETRIERRRIDCRSDVADKIVFVETQSSEERSPMSDVGSDDPTDNDPSKSEKKVENIHRNVEETVIMTDGHVATKSAVEDISSSQQDKKNADDRNNSIGGSQTRDVFQQPEKSEQDEDSPTYDFKTSDIQEDRKSTRESRSEICLESEKQFDGNIDDALMIYNQRLQSSEGIDIEKASALDFVRKQWFAVCGRKTSSPAEVKTFLSLALSYSDALLQTIVNMTDADGNTALHYAVSYSNTDVIRHLLDTGFCDVSHQNKAGYTAIMLASLLLVDMDRHRTIIERLFQSGNVNVPSALSGQTALMLASSHGRNDTVQMLLTCGANINAQDEDGSTALMCASEHGHIDIIKTLLSRSDCDSTLADVDGSTALSIAMEEGYQDIGVLLYAHMKALQGSSPPSNSADDKDLRQPESASSNK